jgi:C_GCAxxG_C_C family probable redox protein
MDRIEKTADLHQNGGMTCSQAILTTFGPDVGIAPIAAKTLGRPLCGINIGKHGICGYINGAAILLGMSRDREEESAARKETSAAVDTLCQQFKAKHGSLHCKDLVGADMRTPEGIKAVRENNLIAKHCYDYGRDVAALLEELL